MPTVYDSIVCSGRWPLAPRWAMMRISDMGAALTSAAPSITATGTTRPTTAFHSRLAADRAALFAVLELMRRLTLGAELDARRVEPGAGQRHRDLVAGEVLPEPAVDAGRGREEGTRRLVALAHLVAFRVALGRALRLAVKVEVHAAGGGPAVDEAGALLHPVLVFHPLARPELERDRVLLERHRLRRVGAGADGLERFGRCRRAALAFGGARGRLVGRRQAGEPEQLAGAQRVDAVLGGQDGRHQHHSRHQHRRGGRQRDARALLGQRQPCRRVVAHWVLSVLSM